MTSVLRSDEKLKARYLAQIPLGRFAEPDEVVSAFTYLASDSAAYVTGQVLCIDGGLYMAS
jgi:3-oxoacyl-[acyl-carrier protein] reductase